MLWACNNNSQQTEKNMDTNEKSPAEVLHWNKTFPESDKVNHRKVSFRNYNGVTLIGDLYLPKGKENEQLPAIVVSHPWGGVKEQTAGLYAQKLAEQGFITLAYDASHYGESGGELRDIEIPTDRVDDIRSSVGYLANLPQVDSEKIGTLGICAGGGYTLDEAQTDKRVKAVATVVAYNIGETARHGMPTMEVSDQNRESTLELVAKELNKEAKGEPKSVVQLLPSIESIDSQTPEFIKQACNYYLTSRGGHSNARNKHTLSALGLHLAYFPLNQIEKIAPRPLLLIAGEKAETLIFSKQAYDKALEPKEFVIIPNAGHFDMYDKPEYVTPAVEKLTDFFHKNLK